MRGLILWSLICTTMFLFLKGVEVLFLWNVRNPSFLVFLPRKSKNRPKIGTYIQEYVPISTIFGTRSTTTKFDIRSIIIIGCQNVRAIEQLRSFFIDLHRVYQKKYPDIVLGILLQIQSTRLEVLVSTIAVN